MQTDRGANPADYALDFQAVALGLKTPRWSADLGYERFDGDGISGFQTPLARDTASSARRCDQRHTGLLRPRLLVQGQVSVPALRRMVRPAAEAHAFRDADGAFERGREIDLSVSLAIDPYWSVEVEAAHFEADHPAFTDTYMGWLILEYRY